MAQNETVASAWAVSAVFWSMREAENGRLGMMWRFRCQGSAYRRRATCVTSCALLESRIGSLMKEFVARAVGEGVCAAVRYRGSYKRRLTSLG